LNQAKFKLKLHTPFKGQRLDCDMHDAMAHKLTISSAGVWRVFRQKLITVTCIQNKFLFCVIKVIIWNKNKCQAKC